MCEGLAHLLGTSRKAPLSFGEMGLDYSFRVTVSHADLLDTTFLTLTSPQVSRVSLSLSPSFLPSPITDLCVIETHAMYMPVRPMVECPVSQLWDGMLGISPSGS